MKTNNLILVLSLMVCAFAQAETFKEKLARLKKPTEASQAVIEAMAHFTAQVEALKNDREQHAEQTVNNAEKVAQEELNNKHFAQELTKIDFLNTTKDKK